MNLVRKSILATLVLASCQLYAQSDSTFLDQIDLYKKYEYAVKKVEKQSDSPVFADTNFIKKEFHYDLPLVGNRESKNLVAPVTNTFTLVTEKEDTTYNNYIIAGWATKLNPFVEASLSHDLDRFCRN